MLTTQSNAIAFGQNKSKFNLCGKTGVFLAVALSASLLTACGGGSSTTTTVATTTSTTPDTTTPTTTPPATTTPAARTFIKMDKDGGDVTTGIERVACVKDSLNGKFWEVKTDEAAGQVADFRDKDYGYFWHDGAVTGTQGAAAGTPAISNASVATSPCSGVGTALTRCDTGAYIKAMNAAKLCGKANWRLPTKDELLSVIDKSRTAPPYIYADLGSTAWDPAGAALQAIRGYWSSTLPAEAALASTYRLSVNFTGKDEVKAVEAHKMGDQINNYLRAIAD